MPVRRRLRRIMLWSGVAIPVLCVMYFGLYMRMVAPVGILHFVATGDEIQIVQSPRYSTAWPVPAQFNQPWLQPELQTLFQPAHALDRRLRPDLWTSSEPIAGHFTINGMATIDHNTYSSGQFEISFDKTGAE